MSGAPLPGLRAVAALHERAVAYRNSLFDSGRRKIERLPRPVVSVGNLTLGGTGKTPFVEELARLLSMEGYLVCILSRGYKGVRSSEPLLVSDLLRIRQVASVAGDEPILLARRLPGVSVVVGADRYAAGLHALEKVPVHLFLLDDGFQHRQLHRDVDIVLVDAVNPWRGNALLPAGALREPRSAIKRAQAIGLTRLHQADAPALSRLREELAAVAPGIPAFATRTVTTGARRLPRGPVDSLDTLAGRPVLVFSGIAKPDSLVRDVESAGVRVVAHREFEDHHPYDADDLRRLLEDAQDAGAEALITTEKDAVRLPAPPPRGLPILAMRQRVMPEAPDALLRFLLSRLPTKN